MTGSRRHAPASPSGARVRIAAEPASSAIAVELAQAYAADVVARIPGVGDVQASPADEGLDPPHGRFVVVWDHSEPVGCGGLRALDAGTAEIKRMWIAPAHRGRGLARQLLAHLEHEAAAWGCGRVVLDTHEALTEAMALYERSGYRPVPAYNDNADATHWFAKTLPAAKPGTAPWGS